MYGEYMPAQGLFISQVVEAGKTVYKSDSPSKSTNPSTSQAQKQQKHAAVLATSIARRRKQLLPIRIHDEEALDSDTHYSLGALPSSARVAIASSPRLEFSGPQLCPDSSILVFDQTCAESWITGSIPSGPQAVHICEVCV